jgi:hypothetical protein
MIHNKLHKEYDKKFTTFIKDNELNIYLHYVEDLDIFNIYNSRTKILIASLDASQLSEEEVRSWLDTQMSYLETYRG